MIIIPNQSSFWLESPPFSLIWWITPVNSLFVQLSSVDYTVYLNCVPWETIKGRHSTCGWFPESSLQMSFDDSCFHSSSKPKLLKTHFMAWNFSASITCLCMYQSKFEIIPLGESWPSLWAVSAILCMKKVVGWVTVTWFCLCRSSLFLET